MTRARDWDAGSYERVSDPQRDWGLEVLERLPLAGDEVVLDAGCGTGRVTRELEARLPRGRVIAVDAAPSMAEAAREALSERSEVLVRDLTELELEEPVDAVFSTAVFHWIEDQERLFRRLHAALRPGGRLVAQCGGAGNVERFLAAVRQVAAAEPYAAAFRGWSEPWVFATPEDTTERLTRAGFEDVRCWLEPREASDRDRDFVRTVCLGQHLEHLPEDRREPFLDAVLDVTGEPPTLEYIRLNIDARRAP